MLAVFMPVLVCMVALLLDRLLGEPRLHPLVIFGQAASWIEKRINSRESRLSGAVSLTVVVGIPVILIWMLQSAIAGSYFRYLLDIMVLSFVIGWHSMRQHAIAVFNPLLEGNLEISRVELAKIVSRDTAQLNQQQIVGSTIESVLENGHDCLYASLFWFAIFGPAGALLHRLVNTLDAMWGYRNERYLNFGFAAARFDDCLGFFSARLTAIAYLLSGSTLSAIKSWRYQIGKHKSPNAGLVMATGAGALEISIGGPVSYTGEMQEKPYLGLGNPAQVGDIPRSIALIEKGLLIWLVVYAIILFALNLISSVES